LIVVGIAVVGKMIVDGQNRSPDLSGWKVGRLPHFQPDSNSSSNGPNSSAIETCKNNLLDSRIIRKKSDVQFAKAESVKLEDGHRKASLFYFSLANVTDVELVYLVDDTTLEILQKYSVPGA